jgi:hypothetical protein
VSERRASLENVDAQIDPITLAGKIDTAGYTSRLKSQSLRRGSGGSMYTKENARNTGSPKACLRD